MDPDLFRLMLDRLMLSQVRAAKLLNVTLRALRYWGSGTNPVPGPVAHLLWACLRVPGLKEALLSDEPARDLEAVRATGSRDWVIHALPTESPARRWDPIPGWDQDPERGPQWPR
jgi:hypothetical protein